MQGLIFAIMNVLEFPPSESCTYRQESEGRLQSFCHCYTHQQGAADIYYIDVEQTLAPHHCHRELPRTHCKGLSVCGRHNRCRHILLLLNLGHRAAPLDKAGTSAVAVPPQTRVEL